MMYPLNIFTPDPVSNQPRPFVTLIALDASTDFKAKSFKDMKSNSIPVGGFTLPMPGNGLVDSVSHDFGQAENPLMRAGLDATGGVLETDMSRWALGMTPDPLMTNIYKGTTARTWTGEWTIIPQSAAEAAAVALIIYSIKKWGSPDKIGYGKVGMLTAPYNWQIVFGNPVLESAMQFHEMSLTGYEINYFAQGYASTYFDGFPKQITLSMSFSEYGIKYRNDWKPFKGDK